MTQGRCMRYRHDARRQVARLTAFYEAWPELVNREPFPMSYEDLLRLADCEPNEVEPFPSKEERRSLAASKKPRQRTVYGPADYARSVPAEVRGTRSTKGVTVIHSGRNRDTRRADAAYAEHTTYVPRTNDVARLGERAKRKARNREEQGRAIAQQRAAIAADRKRRITATATRNARIAAVVAGIETDTATWK